MAGTVVNLLLFVAFCTIFLYLFQEILNYHDFDNTTIFPAHDTMKAFIRRYVVDFWAHLPTFDRVVPPFEET